MAFIFQKNQRDPNMPERSQDAAHLDSMVDSIKGAFTSRFRRQRPNAGEDSALEHSLAAVSEKQDSAGVAGRTETDDANDLNTAVVRTEGTSAAEEEEARAEEEERKRRMRLLRSQPEDEDENVDVDLYHFRRQWVFRPRFSIVLFKAFLAFICVLLFMFHMLNACGVFPTASILFSIKPASYEVAMDTSRKHLTDLLKNRVAVVARVAEYGVPEENENYEGCYVLINNRTWTEWQQVESTKCGLSKFTRYRMLRVFLSPSDGNRETRITCPPTIQYKHRWTKSCCPPNVSSLLPLENRADGGINDMICTMNVANKSSMEMKECDNGTRLWFPLPKINAVGNSFIYSKPTLVQSFERYHNVKLAKYWINVEWDGDKKMWTVDGKERHLDPALSATSEPQYNMTLLLAPDDRNYLQKKRKWRVCVDHNVWTLANESSDSDCKSICMIEGVK